MLKATALVRTLFLAALIGYTVWAMPWSFGLPAGTSEAYDACRSSLSLLTRGIWAAIAWIALDTAIGWGMAARKGRAKTDLSKTGEQPNSPVR